jgi:hypothetical protein
MSRGMRDINTLVLDKLRDKQDTLQDTASTERSHITAQI